MINIGDMVNHPDYYKTRSGLETIEVIRAFTEDLTGIEAVCVGNIIKYITRYKKKNGLQDVKKARWYINYLIDYLDAQKKAAENANLMNQMLKSATEKIEVF